jgi:hypothetical protein
MTKRLTKWQLLYHTAACWLLLSSVAADIILMPGAEQHV